MKQIYNEGRVVGYSSYDIYVRQLLSTDPTAIPMTEKEWLTCNLSESCSMVLKIPSGTQKGYHDYILPEKSQLCCCTALYASVFQGRVSLLDDDMWALRVEDYGNLVSNTVYSCPHTPGEPEDVPAKPDPGTITEASKSRYREYAKITSGLVFQPGEWVPMTYYTQLLTQFGEIVITQQAEELLVPVNDAEIAVNLKPDLTKRGFIRLAISQDLVDDVYIYLHGFVNKVIISGQVSYNIEDISTNPENGDFLGPQVYPWACPIIFIVTNEVEWVRLEDMEKEWAGDLSEVKRRLTVVEDKTTALEARCTTIEDRCLTLENRATVIERRTTVVEERCDDLEEETADLGSRASALEQGLADTNSRVSTAETKITENTGDIQALQSRCTNIEGDIRTIQSDVTSLKGRCTALETRCTNIETKNTSQDTAISALQTRCTNIETKNTSQDTAISELQTRCTSIEAKNTSQDNALATLNTRCGQIETKNSSQDTEINNLKTRCTNIETKNTQQDTSIGQLQTDFTAFKNTVNTRCTDIESVNTNQSNELADHETRITALENSGSVAALETRVAAIEADYVKSSQISDMATKTWVGQQGYLTSSSLSGYATESWVSSNYLSQETFAERWVTLVNLISTGDTNTKQWVSDQHYITSSYLSGYATESWVSTYYVTSSQLTSSINAVNSTISDVVTWVNNNFVKK